MLIHLCQWFYKWQHVTTQQWVLGNITSLCFDIGASPKVFTGTIKQLSVKTVFFFQAPLQKFASSSYSHFHRLSTHIVYITPKAKCSDAASVLLLYSIITATKVLLLRYELLALPDDSRLADGGIIVDKDAKWLVKSPLPQVVQRSVCRPQMYTSHWLISEENSNVHIQIHCRRTPVELLWWHLHSLNLRPLAAVTSNTRNTRQRTRTERSSIVNL